MVAVIMEVRLLTATMYPLLYPRFCISGPSRRVSIAASAVAEPEMPPIIVLMMTETCATPPHIRRVRAEANCRMRWVMPDSFISVPAKIKNGTARNE